jgi:hypothetical protein
MRHTTLALAAALALAPRPTGAAGPEQPAAEKLPSGAIYYRSSGSSLTRAVVTCARGANGALDCELTTKTLEKQADGRCAVTSQVASLTMIWSRPGLWRNVTPFTPARGKGCPEATRITELQYAPASARWSLGISEKMPTRQPSTCDFKGSSQAFSGPVEQPEKSPPALEGCGTVAIP